MPTLDRRAAVSRLDATVCPYCGTGCRILVHGVSAFPLVHDPVSQGALCLRGWGSAELLWSPLRLTAAAERARGAPATAVPVERALDDAAERLLAIRDRHGPASIGVLGSARLTTEECRQLVRLTQALGTPHLDSLQRLGYEPVADLGFDALEEADLVLVLAANLTVRQAQAGRRVLRAIRRGAEVRFIHSRRVQLASLGAAHVHSLPGHELEALEPARDGEILLATTELALSGQGARLLRTARERRTLLLADYVNQRGMIEAGIRPRPDGLSAWEMLRCAAAGELRALVIFADDPFEFFPALAAEAFARAEFVLVADAVHTRATERADIALPGALLAEKDGRVVNFAGRAQEVAAIADPPSGWAEGRLLEQLIRRVGEGASRPPAPASPPPSKRVSDSDRVVADSPADAFPFLAALDTTSFWNTHALSRSSVSTWREGRNILADFPHGCATLNPEDARAIGVRFADGVTLTSADGTVSLAARFHPRVLPGTVWIPMHAWESVGTKLGALAFDAHLRIPIFRPRAVRLSRPGAEGTA
jgi:predicted molibdopterin-dependent oxidoreductase YjgC